MSRQDADHAEETGVIICGGGPTGAMLSALLGSMGVANVVLEKEADITTDPRGIALDEDGIRILQSIGVYDQVYTEIGSCASAIMVTGMWIFNFVTGRSPNLFKKPLIGMNYSTTEGGTGHVGFISHKQPAMEKAIRDRIGTLSKSDFRSGCAVLGVSETSESVSVKYQTPSGEQRSLKAPFLVGCDGKTGFVRKKYLEDKGITMERCEGSNYEETWVALNWHITLPTEKTHPDFPLWRLGYTPLDVYDSFFPKEFRFICNPDRPSVCGRFGLPSDRLWRFEFVVQKGEDGDRMATYEETSKIIFPYLTHPGSRYGLDRPVRFPEDCVKTLRSRPFSFVARSCNKWSLGRVILAGDAAHVFPPFGGQGIASGFRDASALAWRLALLHRRPDADHEKILSAWYTERKQQLERSLAATLRNGEYVTESDPIKVFIREWVMWAIQLVPSWKREVELGSRAEGMIRYRGAPGLPFLAEEQGGLNMPQVYAFDLRCNKVIFTDDLIFSAGKKGLFQLLLLPDTMDELRSLLEEIEGVDEISQGFVRANETTVLVQTIDGQCALDVADTRHKDLAVARLATGEEFAADEALCRNRPEPVGYDEWRLRRDVGGKKMVIVRPDRFTYAACNTREELGRAVRRIASLLSVEGGLGGC